MARDKKTGRYTFSNFGGGPAFIADNAAPELPADPLLSAAEYVEGLEGAYDVLAYPAFKSLEANVRRTVTHADLPLLDHEPFARTLMLNGVRTATLQDTEQDAYFAVGAWCADESRTIGYHVLDTFDDDIQLNIDVEPDIDSKLFEMYRFDVQLALDDAWEDSGIEPDVDAKYAAESIKAGIPADHINANWRSGIPLEFATEI